MSDSTSKASARQVGLLVEASHIPYAQLTMAGHEALTAGILLGAVVAIRRSASGLYFIELNRNGPEAVGSPGLHTLNCVQFEENWPEIRAWLQTHRQERPE